MRNNLLILLLLLFAAPAWANDAALPDPAQEQAARALFSELRCMTCQSESIAESNAPLALDIRAMVREQIAAGKTPGEVKSYLAARYGDYILMKPPLNVLTALLWFGPVILLMSGIGGAFLYFRRQNA